MRSLKYLPLVSFFCFLSFTGNAQIYYKVTAIDTSSTMPMVQVVNGINVTVIRTAHADTVTSCGIYAPYYIGSNHLQSGYKYIFSGPVRQIRSHLIAINKEDTVAIKINGLPYYINASNISFTGANCGIGGADVVINAGMLTGIEDGYTYVQLDLNPGFPIDSLELNEINQGTGVVYDLYFALCGGSLHVSHDTACIGPPLHLYTSNSNLSGSANYSWTGANGFTSTQADPTVSSVTSQTGGLYTVTVNDTGCIYTDSMSIATYGVAAVTLASNGPVCAGDTLRMNITSATVPGITYQWAGPGNFTSTQLAPVIDSIPASDSGLYAVTASVGGICPSFGAIDIVVKPLPAIPVAASNSPLCPGDILKLTATDVTPGVSYHWTGPNAYSSTTQDPQIINAQASSSGSYFVSASSNGCSSPVATTDAVINYITNPPVVTISSSNGDIICIDSVTTYSATGTNLVNPTYQWKKNGIDINGAVDPTYTPVAISNNDIFSCFVTSNAACQPVNTAISDSITMHTVQHNIMPPVTISVYPPVFVAGGATTFTLYVSNNTGLSYQWRKNGINIAGATTSTYTTDTLHAADVISIFVKSSIPCAVPDTETSNLISLGVQQLDNNSNLSLYPNPNKGIFTIQGTATMPVSLDVFNSIGQLMLKKAIQPQRDMIHEFIDMGNIPDGLYLLHFSGNDYNRTIPFIVNK